MQQLANVNNYYREQFGCSPYQKSLNLLDGKVLNLNHLKYIQANDVYINRFIKK